jgi:hypothetical protein
MKPNKTGYPSAPITPASPSPPTVHHMDPLKHPPHTLNTHTNKQTYLPLPFAFAFPFIPAFPTTNPNRFFFTPTCNPPRLPPFSPTAPRLRNFLPSPLAPTAPLSAGRERSPGGAGGVSSTSSSPSSASSSASPSSSETDGQKEAALEGSVVWIGDAVWFGVVECACGE